MCSSGQPIRRSDRVRTSEQLIEASRLYYELGETQSRVAELLGVTRPQVSRILKRARAEGIVEIRIVDRTSEVVAAPPTSSASGSASTPSTSRRASAAPRTSAGG